jgi:hypothetical protein
MGFLDRIASAYENIAGGFNASRGPQYPTQPAYPNQTQTPASQPLDRSISVALDGTGSGIATLGPRRVREHWQLAGASVSVGTNTKEATCDIYIGTTPTSSQFVSNTDSGSTGATCALGGLDIQPGQLVIAKWSGGDANASATLNVTGTYTIGAPQ